MTKILLLSLAGSMLFSGVAHARGSASGELGEKLADPVFQRSIAQALAGMSEALLDMPVEPFVRALRSIDPDAAPPIRPRATLRDMAGPEATRMPQEMARKLPRVMDGVAGMTQTLDRMLPELERMAESMAQAVRD